MEKYVKDFFSRKLHGKSFLEDMKIEGAEEATLLDGNWHLSTCRETASLYNMLWLC